MVFNLLYLQHSAHATFSFLSPTAQDQLSKEEWKEERTIQFGEEVFKFNPFNPFLFETTNGEELPTHRSQLHYKLGKITTALPCCISTQKFLALLDAAFEVSNAEVFKQREKLPLVKLLFFSQNKNF